MNKPYSSRNQSDLLPLSVKREIAKRVALAIAIEIEIAEKSETETETAAATVG